MRVLVLLIVLGVAMIGLTFLLDDVETTARLDKGSSAAPVFEPESEPVKKTEKPKEPEKPPTNIGAQVKDTKGNAIEGVRVVLYPFKSGLKAAPLDGAVETDAEGRFTIDLPGAGAQVVFRHREYIFFKLHLPGGTEKINDVSLAKGAPLRVTVFDPDRKPLARALVSARWVLERGVAGMWSWDHDQELDTVPTGPDGRAHLAAVMPGNVRIRIDHPRYAPEQLEIVVERLDEPVEKEVVLSWGGTITGRVLAPDRTPVEGAKVTRRRVYETARYALTDDEGHYELTGVAAGEVRVVATAETYGPGYFGSEIGWGEPVPVSLKQGETVAGIDIV
ncbi:MAG: carboxypeptidase-like regulatory domain-containing protein, partial [Planctomycetota bacterium]|nr:carboxypeptidase-like regulatory domain-containing protein [Planctomycetota bacterium]